MWEVARWTVHVCLVEFGDELPHLPARRCGRLNRSDQISGEGTDSSEDDCVSLSITCGVQLLGKLTCGVASLSCLDGLPSGVKIIHLCLLCRAGIVPLHHCMCVC
jgi:hypothetical protein